jgi:hypothetical protein
MPGKPFPIDQAKIVQITKVDPKKIVLDPLAIPNLETKTGTPGQGAPAMPIEPSKFMGAGAPLIAIDGDVLDVGSVSLMKLTVGGSFLPNLSFTFNDNDQKYKGSRVLGDSTVVSLFLRGPGDDKFYKPVRIDFNVTSFQEIGADTTTYKVSGNMRIPSLYRDTCTSLKDTSFNALLKISNSYGLGFASNVESTTDDMVWINPTDYPIDFIESISKSAYLDEESFFTVFVDQFYNMNFVEVNRLFNHDGTVSVAKNYGTVDFSANPTGYPKTGNEGVNYPQIYGNYEGFQGSGKYVREYSPFNRANQITNNTGYRKFNQYYDMIEKKFISEYAEALSNTGNDATVLLKGRYVPDKTNPESFVREYEKGDASTPIDKVLNFKMKYLGKQCDNMHKNFFYSNVFNSQNLKEIDKFGIEILLDQLDQTITMYDRIFVTIFSYGTPAASATLNNEVLNKVMNPGLAGQLAQSTELKKIIDSFQNPQDGNSSAVLSDTYTGVYVVTGIKYEYDLRKDQSIKTRVTLSRRDYSPAP